MEQEFTEFGEFRESDKSSKYELGSVQRSCLSCVCLAGAVVASWSLTQEVAGWQVRALVLWWQIFLSLNSVKTFRENSINPFWNNTFITLTISMYTLLHVHFQVRDKISNLAVDVYRRHRPKLRNISSLWIDQFKHTSIKIDLPSFWFCSELWPRTRRVLPACVRTRAAMRSASTRPSWRGSERSRGRRRWRCSRSSWTDRCSPLTRGLKIITRIKINASSCK